MYEVELCEQIMDELTQGWIREKRATTLFDIEWEQILGNTFRTFKRSADIFEHYIDLSAIEI